MAIIQCPECGKEISDQAEVCIYCGYRLRAAQRVEKWKPLMKYAPKAAIVLGIVVALLLIWRIALPDLFVPVDELLAEGQYAQAYRKTFDEDKRELILLENQIAAVCQDASDRMINPASFRLLEAAYIMDSEVLISVSGSNSYGNTVTNFWRYDYEGEGRYKYGISFSDFEESEYNSWDSVETSTQKLVENIAKAGIKSRLQMGLYTLLPDESIDRINRLFARGMLDDVKLIPRPQLTPTPEPAEETVTSTPAPEK